MTRMNRCNTEVSQDQIDKTFVSDEEQKLSERALLTKIAYESFGLLTKAKANNQEAKDKLYEIIVNDFELLDSVIELIDELGLQLGFESIPVPRVVKSFEAAKKVRDLGYEAIRSNVESELEGK